MGDEVAGLNGARHQLARVFGVAPGDRPALGLRLADAGDQRLGAMELAIAGRVDGLAMEACIERAVVTVEHEQMFEINVLSEVVVEVGVGPGGAEVVVQIDHRLVPIGFGQDRPFDLGDIGPHATLDQGDLALADLAVHLPGPDQ